MPSQHATSERVRRLEDLTAAADYAKVSTKTVRRWIAAGSLVGYRAGPRLIRVDLNELDRMLTPVGEAS